MQKFIPLSPVMLLTVYEVIDIKTVSYLYYVLHKQLILYTYSYGLLKNRTHAETTRMSANCTHTELVLIIIITIIIIIEC